MKKTKTKQNPKWLEDISNKLKQKQTSAESMFELYLEELKLDYQKQVPITTQNEEKYVVDFLFSTKNIIVEIDGLYHTEGTQKVKDNKREKELKKSGYYIYRFTNYDIYHRTYKLSKFFKEKFKKYKFIT